MKQWWDVLGVARGSDRAAIRRAYARQLKITNPEDDPQAFMALREAYEAALNWVDYDVEDFDEVEHPDADVRFEAVASSTFPTADVAYVEPSAESPPPDPFAEARAAEQAELSKLTTALDTGLRGPWHGDAATLATKLDAILSAPALIEIDTRDRIEYWLSDLLADTVPRSDVILMQAVNAFGWEQEGNRPHAVWQILGRIDEWRMIESLNNSDHSLAAGWRALTKGGAADWRRRISALRPGVTGQVQQLLDLADYQAPGIAHSFDPAAAAWWRDYLVKPRFGFIDLVAILIGAVAALVCALVIEPLTVRVASVTAMLVAGVGFVVLRLRIVAPWRLRRDQAGIDAGWASQGWLALWIGAALLVIWTPAGPWMAAIVVAMCVISGVWMAAAVGHEPRIGSAIGGIVSFGALALLGGAAFFALTGPEQLALFAFGAVSLLMGSAGSAGVRDVLWRAGSRPVAAATLLAVLLLAAAAGRSLLPAPPQPLVPFGAAAIAGMVVMSAVRDLNDARWLSRVAPLLRWALWVTLIIAAVASSPPVEHTPRPVVVDQPDPGFGALQTGNPQLHRAITDVRTSIATGKRNAEEGGRAIDVLVNAAYRERLPRASSALLAAEFEIQLATMREYRTLDLGICADGERNGTNAKLSRGLQQRHYQHALAVAASQPASADDLAAGRVIPMIELLKIASKDDAGAAQMSNAVAGTEQRSRCDARIALLEALSAQTDADIAQTMRPALIARAGKSSAKQKGVNQAP